MVGPSRSEVEERSAWNRLTAGIVLLVALSGGLMGLYGGAPLAVVVAATVAGGILGTGLAWYLVRISPARE